MEVITVSSLVYGVTILANEDLGLLCFLGFFYVAYNFRMNLYGAWVTYFYLKFTNKHQEFQQG